MKLVKMKPLRHATIGPFSPRTNATFWMDARKVKIRRQRVERGIVLQVNIVKKRESDLPAVSILSVGLSGKGCKLHTYL